MSETTREKFCICPAQKTRDRSAAECPFLRQFGPGEETAKELPGFLGGTFSPVPATLRIIE